MKIVHITWALSIGGYESMLVDITNEQAKTEDIHLLIINNIIDSALYEKISSRVKCHHVNRPPGSKNPFYIFLYNFILLKIKPDVIHFHNQELITISYLKKFLKCKTYLTAHTTDIPSANFTKFDKIFSISDAVKLNILKNSGINATTIPNGITIEKIKIKNKYSFKTFRIVQIGRLNKELKGQDILLVALYLLIKKHNMKNIWVDFIGEGKSKKFLLNMAKKLNISAYCNFAGSQTRDYIYSNLNTYNLLVQPSRIEGFGLTVVEAMAAKVPVLVSDIDGPIEIINSGAFGYYFKSEDSKNCADMLFEIINHYQNPELKVKVNNGLKHIKKMYSLQKTAKEYIKNYS